MRVAQTVRVAAYCALLLLSAAVTAGNDAASWTGVGSAVLGVGIVEAIRAR